MKLLKILSIMLLAVIWTILFAYVILHGSSDILYSVMGVSVAACYVFLAFYQKKGNHTHEWKSLSPDSLKTTQCITSTFFPTLQLSSFTLVKPSTY